MLWIFVFIGDFMKYCTKCKYFSEIQNTKETGMGICKFTESFQPINIKNDCPFIPEKKHKLTCGDCEIFGEWSCFTCEENQKACGIAFEDKLINNIKNPLYQLYLQGRCKKEDILKLVEQEIDSFKSPLDEEKE